MKRYPKNYKQSAVMPLLDLAQRQVFLFAFCDMKFTVLTLTNSAAIISLSLP